MSPLQLGDGYGGAVQRQRRAAQVRCRRGILLLGRKLRRTATSSACRNSTCNGMCQECPRQFSEEIAGASRPSDVPVLWAQLLIRPPMVLTAQREASNIGRLGGSQASITSSLATDKAAVRKTAPIRQESTLTFVKSTLTFAESKLPLAESKGDLAESKHDLDERKGDLVKSEPAFTERKHHLAKKEAFSRSDQASSRSDQASSRSDQASSRSDQASSQSDQASFHQAQASSS